MISLDQSIVLIAYYNIYKSIGSCLVCEVRTVSYKRRSVKSKLPRFSSFQRTLPIAKWTSCKHGCGDSLWSLCKRLEENGSNVVR